MAFLGASPYLVSQFIDIPKPLSTMAEQSDTQSLIQMLAGRMEGQDARLERQKKQQDVTNDLLLRLLQQQQALFGLHQNFQKDQAGFNERQDQYNIIFLDKIRDTKHDVRGLKKGIGTLRAASRLMYVFNSIH